MDEIVPGNQSINVRRRIYLGTLTSATIITDVSYSNVCNLSG